MENNLQPEELVEQLFEGIKGRLIIKLQHISDLNLASQDLKDKIDGFCKSEDKSYQKFINIFPITSKNDLFLDSTLLKKSVTSLASTHRSVIFSAGTTGKVPSFRLVSVNEEKSSISVAEHAIVKSLFENGRKNFVLINAYPFGIKTSELIPTLDVGPRPDLLKSVLNQLKDTEQSLLILCQPNIVSNLLRDKTFSQSLSSNQKSLIKFVLGGAWHSKYLDSRISNTFSDGGSSHVSSYGAAEIGLGIGIADRNMLDLRFEKHFKSNSLNSTPLIFNLDSENYFIESIQGKIIITPLSSTNNLPLLRYAVGDCGDLIGSSSRYQFTVKPRSPEKPVLDSGYIEELIDGTDEIFYSTTGRFKISGRNLFVECNSEKSEKEVSAFFNLMHGIKTDTKVVDDNVFALKNIDFFNKWYRYNEF